MSEPTEAAKAAADIFPSMSVERRLQCQADLMQRRKVAERIIQRLLDEQDAEISLRLKHLWMKELGFSETEILKDCHPAAGIDAELDEVRSLFHIRNIESERLKKENKILELRNRGSLANNLCPDCRDKIAGMSCLRCEIERLKHQLDKARDDILHADANVLDNDQVNYVLDIIDSIQLAESTNPDQGGDQLAAS